MIKLTDPYGIHFYVNPEVVIAATPMKVPAGNKPDTAGTRLWMLGLQGEESYFVALGTPEQNLRTLGLI